MTTNIKSFAIGATEKLHYARLDIATGTYPHGSSGAIVNASDQSMLTYKGFATYADTPASADAIPIEADARNIGTMFSRALAASVGALTFATVDGTFQAVAENLTIYTDGDYEKVGIDDSCPVLNDLCMIINSHATSLEAASLDEKGFAVLEIFKTTAEKGDSGTSGSDFTAQPQSYALTYSNKATDLEGIVITDLNYNRTRLRGQLYWSENPIKTHTLMGDGIVTTVTLDETPAAETGDKVQVSIDGVRQDYTTDYTVVASTGILTFVAAPAAGENVVVKYEYLLDC